MPRPALGRPSLRAPRTQRLSRRCCPTTAPVAPARTETQSHCRKTLSPTVKWGLTRSLPLSAKYRNCASGDSATPRGPLSTAVAPAPSTYPRSPVPAKTRTAPLRVTCSIWCARQSATRNPSATAASPRGPRSGPLNMCSSSECSAVTRSVSWIAHRGSVERLPSIFRRRIAAFRVRAKQVAAQRIEAYATWAPECRARSSAV